MAIYPEDRIRDLEEEVAELEIKVNEAYHMGHDDGFFEGREVGYWQGSGNENI